MCLLKKRRGNRGGRRYGNKIPVRIKARLELNYVDGISANRRRCLSNLVTVCKQPFHSSLNTSQHDISAFNKIKFALWNAQSLQKKSGSVCDIISSNRLDIFAITETWLNCKGNNISLAEILNTVKDFKVIQIPRENAKGGGVALFLRKAFTMTRNSGSNFTSFEHLDVYISHGKFKIRLVLIYRPPPSKKNKLTTLIFFEEFSQLVEILTEDCTHPLAIVGDFNFHVDTPNNQDALKFNDLLDSMNLVQHVEGSTHRGNHTLDLIITRREEELIANVQVLPDVYSDHKVVSCTMNYSKPPSSKVLITYRSTKTLDATKLQTDINNILSKIDSLFEPSLDHLMSLYNRDLKDIYNTAAPIQSRWIKQRFHAPCYNQDLRQVKREKRPLERKLKKSGLVVDQQKFESKCVEYNSLIETTKMHFYKSRIEQTDRNQLFRLIDGFFKIKNTALPTYDSLKQLTEDFNNFFINKIRDIHKELSDLSNNTHLLHNMEKRNIHCELSEFIPPSNKNTKDVMMSFSNKTNTYRTTHIVKDNINLLLPLISKLLENPSKLESSQLL
ncbi:uncharacterized protein LOC111320602 [Stylophora pistillata]|uniref:uncharacterized protein LOC111320602 n=1 Tax=Stylophora pistillata TaxID=50429 RepID=UPI000C04E6D8|nr:uncharacterized protein LOC111320602 [Stylophora pistillata]